MSSVVDENSIEKETTTEDGKTIENFIVKVEAQEKIAKAREEGKIAMEINIDSDQEATTIVNVATDILQSAIGMNLVVNTTNATLELPAILVEALVAEGQNLSITVERGDAMAVSSQMSGVAGTAGIAD